MIMRFFISNCRILLSRSTTIACMRLTRMSWRHTVAPRPDAQCQGGGRSVRQPRITARTATTTQHWWKSLHQQAQKCYKWFNEAILVGQHVHPSMAPIKVYWKRKSYVRLRLGVAPLHRFWLGYWFLASLSINLQAWVEEGFFLRPGYMKSQYEYNDVLASNVTTSYKQSRNQASTSILSSIICNMAIK